MCCFLGPKRKLRCVEGRYFFPTCSINQILHIDGIMLLLHKMIFADIGATHSIAYYNI